MEEAEKEAIADGDPDSIGTESAAQRARLYRVLANSVENQTRILAQIEKDLLERPTKNQGVRWIGAGMFVTLFIVGLMFASLLSISQNNQINGRIIRAATGCGSVSTVKECEKSIAARSQSQLGPYLQQQDCLTRRALVGLPPSKDYTTPCQLPTIPQGGP